MYKVTIIEIEEVEVTRRGQWTTIEERPYTEEELNDMASYDRNQCEGKIKKVLGYTPDVKSIDDKETKILEQTVENLDIGKVIKAINDL